MNAYIFRAALYCESCAADIVKDLVAMDRQPADPSDESSYDSDDYPKGPYSNGGGEADTPQHCDRCDVFLENPLTDEGYDWLREQVDYAVTPPNLPGPTLQKWSAFYFES